MWLINCHTATEGKDETINDEFYNTLERAYFEFPSNGIKLALGGFNPKIRHEDTHNGTVSTKQIITMVCGLWTLLAAKI